MRRRSNPSLIVDSASIDFGKTAADYAEHRAGFPDDFFKRIQARGFIRPGIRLLDLGCGAGTIARGMAQRGCETTGLDIALPLLQKARHLNAAAGVQGDWLVARAEALAFGANAFDLVTAGQCWHWFDGVRVAREVKRVLAPGGRLVIAHFDWLPYPGNIVEATEALILRHNPAWAFSGGDGFYPQWLTHLRAAGFVELETFSFDLTVKYTSEAWRGRIRASAGVAATLDAAQVAAFDADMARLLQRRFPLKPLCVRASRLRRHRPGALPRPKCVRLKVVRRPVTIRAANEYNRLRQAALRIVRTWH